MPSEGISYDRVAWLKYFPSWLFDFELELESALLWYLIRLLKYEKAYSLRLLVSAARVYTRSMVINFRIPGH